MSLEGTNEHPANRRSYCEIGKTLIGEKCRRPGEVQLDGSLLCVRHAELLELEDHSDIQLTTVFEMDKWLDNPHNRTDEMRRRRVLHERSEIVEQLRFTRTQIEGLRSESTAKQDETVSREEATSRDLLDNQLSPSWRG